MTLFLPLPQSADVGALIVYEQQRPPSPQPHPRPELRVPRQQAPGYDQPPNRPGHGVFSDATAGYAAATYAQPRPDPRANLGHQPLFYPVAEDDLHSSSYDGLRSGPEEVSDEDEETRQRRIEDEISRRDVTIVTVPKRKLWVTNPS